MDKKMLLSQSLATIMNSYKADILRLIHGLSDCAAKTKGDGTPVTELDMALSKLVINFLSQKFPNTTMYSEEEYSDWKFPLMAIDPLDGTREYIENRPEWVISVGHLTNDQFEGEGWIFNPLKNEIFQTTSPVQNKREQYRGEVSRSEWSRGWYKDFSSPKYELAPMGSIAYKLGRLSSGEIDFVVSLAPKNIWDIAAGTILCKSAGINFWAGGKLVTKVEKIYHPPLIWCREEIFLELSELFPHSDTDL